MKSEEIAKEFSKRLKHCMQLVKINQKELAIRSCISEASISKYLNCKIMPTIDSVIKLAEALNVEPGWLITF